MVAYAPPVHLLNCQGCLRGFAELDISNSLAFALPVLVDLNTLHLQKRGLMLNKSKCVSFTSPNLLNASLKSSSSTVLPQTMNSREFGGTLSFFLESFIAMAEALRRAVDFFVVLHFQPGSLGGAIPGGLL